MMTISLTDIPIIFLIAFLEVILSLDNALVLALLARPLPTHLQRKALSYGLLGAVVFRVIALGLVTYLQSWKWLKILGGGYLIFIAQKHFLKKQPKQGDTTDQLPTSSSQNFWKTVLLIEVTDLAFAADSILAAVSLSDKFWIILFGGLVGVVAMRFVANLMIRLLDRFPNLERTAYQLVLLVGLKVVIETGVSGFARFHFIFWGLMALSLGLGFSKRVSQN